MNLVLTGEFFFLSISTATMINFHHQDYILKTNNVTPSNLHTVADHIADNQRAQTTTK